MNISAQDNYTFRRVRLDQVDRPRTIVVRDRNGVPITRVDAETVTRLLDAGAEFAGQRRRMFLRVPIDWAAHLEAEREIEDVRSIGAPDRTVWQHVTKGPRREHIDHLLLKALLKARRTSAARLEPAVGPDGKPTRVWRFFGAEA